VLGGSAFATYADDSYMGAYFGVGAASPSGLAAFSPGGGFKDVGLSAFAAYQLNQNWSLVGFARVSELVGDAADSPIVTQTGNTTQALVGFGVSYTFN
jgi:outer membrane scaffolding protein for murein synthesis (MipA/OmpV family)